LEASDVASLKASVVRGLDVPRDTGIVPLMTADRRAASAARRLKRPTRLPIPRVDMSETTSEQLVVFSLGAEEYALPIAAVQEIIRFSEPRSVAFEVAWIRGVIALRGKIIPIYDLSARLELPGTGSEPGKIVILDTCGDQVGVMVDEVEEVLTVESGQLEPVPNANTDTIEAIAKIDDRLVILLNPEGLFAATPAADEVAAAAA
jgi:purine-binding chemotaxis protein CheW